MGLFSRKASNENDEIACPKCGRHLGVRKELIAAGVRVTEDMQEERSMMGKPPIKGAALFVCPACDHVMVV